MIDVSNFITRNPIEDFSLQFVNEQKNFISSQLFPVKLVNNSLKSVYQYDTSMMRSVNTKNDSKAQAPIVDYNLFKRNISLDLHKLAAEMDPKDARDADKAVSDLRMDAATNIMSRLLISKELAAATLATTSSNYMSSLYSSLSATPWNSASGDPENDAITAHNALVATIGRPANSVALSGTTLRKLKLSASFRDRVKYTTGGPVSDEAIKAFFGVQNLFVSDARYEAGTEGQASTGTTDIWGSNVIFFYQDTNPGLRSISYGHTFLINQLYSHESLEERRGSGAGRLSVLEMGWEWTHAAGYVESSSSSKFAAGYLFASAVS